MAQVDYSADWTKNWNPAPFGDLLNAYRGGGNEVNNPIENYYAAAKKYNFSPDPNAVSTLSLISGFQGPKQPGYFEPGGLKDQIKDIGQMKKDEADYAQKLGKESAREALLLSSISKIGPMLATALGGPSWETIERNRQSGLNAINSINPSTLQGLPPAQFQPRSYYS